MNAGAIDLDRRGSGNSLDPRDAACAIAPSHRLGELQVLASGIARSELERGEITEPIAIGAVDHQQSPVAIGQRYRIAAQAQRRADQ